MMIPSPILELRDLGCERGGRQLFRGLNLGVPAGRLLRVTGANGAGKTSLLRMVCGLLTPASGEVLWCGERAGGANEAFRRQLVYIGHAAALKDELDATENLLSAVRLGGSRASAGEAAAALLATGLRGHQGLPVRSLSQGQRKRVSLARLMLADDASLWVLDEPFGALDIAASAWLVHLISAHVAHGGVVLLTGHQEPTWPDGVPQLALAL